MENSFFRHVNVILEEDYFGVHITLFVRRRHIRNLKTLCNTSRLNIARAIRSSVETTEFRNLVYKELQKGFSMYDGGDIPPLETFVPPENLHMLEFQNTTVVLSDVMRHYEHRFPLAAVGYAIRNVIRSADFLLIVINEALFMDKVSLQV